MILLRYRVNSRALLARVVYRWHWQVLLSVVALTAGCAIASGLIPPVWRGAAALTVVAASGATVTVDNRSWPFTLYAGEHTVAATLPDGRVSWTTVELKAGQALTLTLPRGLATPRVRQIPPAAPGTTISSIGWADGAWRVHSSALPELGQNSGTARTGDEHVPVMPAQTVAITAEGLEPLATLDAYGGRADHVQVNGTRREAVYRADTARGRTNGVLHVRGWSDTTETIGLSQTLTLVRWSPTGTALALAEQVGADAEQLSILRRGGTLEAVVAVPGHIHDIRWSSDGLGLVLWSQRHNRLTLTLARITPTIAARVIAEVQAPVSSGTQAAAGQQDMLSLPTAMPPLHWHGATLEWISPDEQGIAALWSAPLSSLIPERRQTLAAAALGRTRDGVLRVVAVHDGQLVIGQPQAHGLIVEAVIPGIPPGADLAGQWSPDGRQLVLQRGTTAWLVDLANDEAPTATSLGN